MELPNKHISNTYLPCLDNESKLTWSGIITHNTCKNPLLSCASYLAPCTSHKWSLTAAIMAPQPCAKTSLKSEPCGAVERCYINIWRESVCIPKLLKLSSQLGKKGLKVCKKQIKLCTWFVIRYWKCYIFYLFARLRSLAVTQNISCFAGIF